MGCRGHCWGLASTPPRPGPPSRRCWCSPWTSANVLLTLVALVVVVLALILGASYVLRVAVLVGLTVAGPLALAGHALPQTEALARWWWRGITACLAIPVAQSLALITALRVFFHADQDQVLGLGSARLVDLLVGEVPVVVVGPHPHLGGPHGLCWPAGHGGDRRQVLCRLPAGLRRGLHRLTP